MTLQDTVVQLARRIADNPQEREVLCEALRVKIAEMRRRGETVPDEIRDLEAALQAGGETDDLWDNLPV